MTTPRTRAFRFTRRHDDRFQDGHTHDDRPHARRLCWSAITPRGGGARTGRSVEWFPLSIRFDNDVRDYVHVYLIGDGRQWLLGRVEPGAVATLKIPDAAVGAKLRFVQLAVIMGGRLTPDAAHDRRAELTTLQPAAAILSQQWRFSQGEITSLAARVR